MSLGRWGLGGALLLGLLGCSLRPPRIGAPPPTLPDARAEASYQEVLARYTDRAEIYADFETRMFLGATLQAPDFREARARRLGAFRAEPEEVIAQRLAEERAEWARVHEVFLGVHLTEPRYDDLDAPDSVWRLALVTSAGEATPLRITRVGRAGRHLRALYPYLDDFWVGYRLEFPRLLSDGRPLVPEGEETVRLRIASTLGRAELTFPAP